MASLGEMFKAADYAGSTHVDAIDELRQHRQWVGYRIDVRPDKGGVLKPTKPLVNPHTGFGASHSKPDQWGTYHQAVACARRKQLPGVGFVISPDDDYTGIDLDKCRDAETGEIDQWALDVLDFEETYAEISPSGTGLRLIARGKIEKTEICHEAGVELYHSQRYLTITGQHIIETPPDIREAPHTIAYLMDRIERMKPKKVDLPVPMHTSVAATPIMASSSDGSGFFRAVNDMALARLGAWVPSVFPTARPQPGTGAYRVSSRALGRDLQEDLSLSPDGIKDFGVADMGDARLGARTAIDVLIEWGGQATPLDAARWLCDRMGVAPEALGFGA
jgi:hypothetical protein